MSKKKSLFLSLALVLIVGLSIVAGTFAYFQWQAATGTQVNVTIEMGGIKMHIEPEATGFVGLYPTAHCLNNVRYGDTLVRIENNTGALAIPSFKLKVAINPSVPDTGKLNDYKDNIHYAVVALETNKDGSKKLSNGNVVTIGGNTIDELVTGTCSAPLNVSNTTDNDNTFKSDYGKVATGLFNVITAENTFADTSFLPREYNSTTGEVQGVTFRGEAYSTSYQWYRVYVWIDEGYTTTIVGNNVTDPLQNAQIQVTWSENSMLQQVSGVSNVEEELAPGLYDLENNMVKTWDELLTNNDITVEDNVITDSNRELTGKLVIPEGITEIGDTAFEGTNFTSVEIPASVTRIGWGAFEFSSLNTITFVSGSLLTEIDSQAFAYSRLTSFEIPASVTSIGSSAFSENNFGDNLTFASGSQITEIGYSAFSSAGITSFEIPASVTTIGDGAFSGNKFGDNLTFASGSQITEIGYSAFAGSKITSIEIPASVITISSGAFSYTGLTSVEIPASVTSIGSSAFNGNNFGDNLTFASGSQITEIGDNAFAGSGITSIEIPASVTTIGFEAFRDNNFGDNLTFEQNSRLQTIDDHAFSTAGITSVEFPASLRRIGSYAFSMNNLLSSLSFKGTTTAWNAVEKSVEWNFAVPATKVECSDGEVLL